MDIAAVLTLYDREQRREITFPDMERQVLPGIVRFVRPRPAMSFVLYSDLDEATADAAIDAQIAYFRGHNLKMEWKVYGHDRPADLAQRLIARGFEPEDEDAIMVLDVARAPAALLAEPAADVRRLTDPGQLADVVGDLKQTVLDAIANNGGLALKSEMDGAVKRMVSILNTQVDGKYIYGGTRQDVPPVTVQSLTDLLALPATADAFQNNAVAQSAKIDNAQTIEFGQLASALGQPLFDIIRQLGAFDAGVNGPIADKLTTVQSDFLTTMLPGLTQAYQDANEALARNGVAYRAADDAVNQHADTRATLAGLISDIEDVDMAEAITKLNNAQTALQASAKTFATVQNLTLLDYLPT